MIDVLSDFAFKTLFCFVIVGLVGTAFHLLGQVRDVRLRG